MLTLCDIGYKKVQLLFGGSEVRLPQYLDNLIEP